MKNLFLLSTVAAITLFAFNANAGSAEGQGTIGAKIVKQIEVKEVKAGAKGMYFGTWTNKSNTITLGTDGNATGTDQTARVNASGDPSRAGEFNIEGPADVEISQISVKNTSEKIKSGENEMTVSDFNLDKTSGTIGADGKLNVKVGAKLAVAANQEPGDYTGSYTVQVTY